MSATRILLLACVLAVAVAAPALAENAKPAADAPARPFGSHLRKYVAGSGLPSQPQPALDAEVAAFYDAWKARYLHAGCTPGRWFVQTAPDTPSATVSEAHGYGMIITALMAGHDADARRTFDGLYAWYTDHPSAIDPALMAWSQNDRCKSTRNADSASDGDLDIAYALLLADAQWGSAGAVDYRAAARRLIEAILRHDVAAGSNHVLLGDWAGDDRRHRDGVRPSDLMVGHFKAFQAAGGDARWAQVAERSYRLIDRLQHPDTGLVPDFAVHVTAAVRPAPPRWLEGPRDGDYGWNACRVPWRIGTDALVSGDGRARTAAHRLSEWFKKATHGDPARVMSGYTLAGRPVRGAGAGELGFVAPLAVAAAVGRADKAWLDALWNHMRESDIAGAGYYGNTLKLLSMIVVSRNWWTPG